MIVHMTLFLLLEENLYGQMILRPYGSANQGIRDRAATTETSLHPTTGPRRDINYAGPG